MWLGVDLRLDTKKTCGKRGLDYKLKYGNHSRLNDEHDWGGPIGQFNEHKNFHFDND
jgi:hypothetical protein